MESVQSVVERCGSIACIVRLYTHQWTISNYNLVKHCPEKIISPDYNVGENDLNVLQVHLSPSKDNLKIEVFLNKKNCADIEYTSFIKADLNLEFLDNNEKVLDYFIGLPCDNKYVNKYKNYYWKKEDNVSRLIENNSLKIRIKLSIKYVRKLEVGEILFSKSVDKLSIDFMKLIGNKMFSDLCVKVSGQCFFGHRSILLPQLSYIQNLNSNLVEENEKTKLFNQATVNISDNCHKNVDIICIPNEHAETFQSVLHYLYTGKIPLQDNSNPFGLYEFALRNQLYELCMNLKPDEMHFVSQPKTIKNAFYWYVKEYSVKSLDKFNYYRSSAYKVPVGADYVSWNLSLFFFEPCCIFLSLQKEGDLDKDVTVAFKLMVCNPDGTPHIEREFIHNFSSKMPAYYPGFLDPESRFTITPDLFFDDTLTLCCNMEIFDGQLSTEVSRVHRGELPKFDFKIWIKNLQNLLDTGKFSDVSFKVDDTEFKVHKAILSARSPVFAKMFEIDMSEKLNGSVKIEDISSYTMKCALTHIYTGRLDAITMSEAPELYRTADKYEILDLKDRCREFIMGNLDAESATEVLILADVYNEKEMKEAAKNFICRNASLAFLTDCGQELMVNHPHLAQDILDRLSAAFCSLPGQDMYSSFHHGNSLASTSADDELAIPMKINITESFGKLTANNVIFGNKNSK